MHFSYAEFALVPNEFRRMYREIAEPISKYISDIHNYLQKVSPIYVFNDIIS